MKTGMDMMLGSLMKSMGLEPEAIKQTAQQIGETIIALKDQLDRIERKLDAVLVARLTSEIDETQAQENDNG